MKKLLVIFLCLISFPTFAKHLHPEAYYQNIYCNKNAGQQEVTLNNGLIADCMTEKEIIELDFAIKYRESIIQALEYAEETGKRAKTVLIVEKDSDQKYVNRALQVIKFYNLPVSVEVYSNCDHKKK